MRPEKRTLDEIAATLGVGRASVTRALRGDATSTGPGVTSDQPPATNDYALLVGARLRQARQEARLTLRAVEVLSRGRFKPITVQSYEAGTRSLTVQKAAELAGLYGVPLAQLLAPAANEQPPSPII